MNERLPPSIYLTQHRWPSGQPIRPGPNKISTTPKFCDPTRLLPGPKRHSSPQSASPSLFFVPSYTASTLLCPVVSRFDSPTMPVDPDPATRETRTALGPSAPRRYGRKTSPVSRCNWQPDTIVPGSSPPATDAPAPDPPADPQHVDRPRPRYSGAASPQTRTSVRPFARGPGWHPMCSSKLVAS